MKTSMLNTLNPKTDSSDYLPEPWWGNDGVDPLDSVCVNLNPGKGEACQMRCNFATLSSYDPTSLALTLSKTDKWHREKRADPIAKALRSIGIPAKGGNSGNLDIELVPWHSAHATYVYGFYGYIKNNAQDIFDWGLSFAADESRRITNNKLKNTVILRMSAKNAEFLFRQFKNCGAIQSFSQSQAYNVCQNAHWKEYKLNVFSGFRFVCIWRSKGWNLNDFPSDAVMSCIFSQL